MKIYNKLKYIFLVPFALICAFMVNTGVNAQTADIAVRGVVVDNSGQPLPGASILVEGTTTGTTTDNNGAFSITSPAGRNLLISFIGYKTQKIIVTSTDVLNIKLEDDAVALEEAVVVAVGYGVMRKSDLTGAIASVSASSLKKGVVTSSEQLLQGKVAGLTVIQGTGDPSKGASVRLRGGTSLGNAGANSPLFVVDGIPGVDINSIQPSEITSVDVLKDASSAAIYGSRGANGVIMITTNRAKKGKSVEYSGYVAVGYVAHHLDLLSADQWRQHVRDNNILNAVDYGGDTDWQKELEQTSVAHSHTLSYNSGSADGGFHVSLNYLNNEGVVKRTYLKRMGLNASGYQFAFNNKLKLEAGINTNFDNWSVLDDRIFVRAYNLNPTIPVRDANGNFSKVSNTLYENPVEINTNRDSEDTRHRLLGYAKAELEIVKDLKAIVNLSYEYNSHQGALYKPSYAVMEGQSSLGVGQKTLGDYRNSQLETYLTYSKEFGNHKLNLLGGYSYLDNTADGFGAYRESFNSDYFSYNNLGAGYKAQAGDVYSYKNNSKLVSFYGRVNYSLLGRYMLTGTLRQDGSTRFGKNNKWGLFPSASLAWRVSDESFMEGTSHWLSNLKLRLGYGVTGNQDGISNYASLYIVGTSIPTSGGGSTSVPYYDALSGQWKLSYGPSQNANPDLKWESTATTNIGVDFSLFSIINGTVEIYQKETSDLLYTYDVPVPPYLVGTQLANVGSLSNKGIEVSLNANVIKTNDFSWDVNLNVSHNKQKVEKLSDALFKLSQDETKPQAVATGSLHGLTGMSNVFAQTLREGYAVGTFWGPKCEGLDENGKYILSKDTTDLGNVQPKVNLGFSTTLSYKQFDLGISTYGMFGQKVLNATAMILNDGTRLPVYNVPDDQLSSGIKSTPKYSDYWIEDASFFRLQSVTLGYNLAVKKAGIERMRFYATGENLFVITKYKGVDPEVSIDGLSAPGIDVNNYYPKPRTFSLGVNISF